MSTYMERLQAEDRIALRLKEAADTRRRAEQILNLETCRCAFCVSRREQAE